MEILYLIGNGFDIAQGLKTKYTDFYEKYSKLPELNTSQAALKLRKEIAKDYSTWADMELSFGKYTKEIPVNSLEEVYYDLSDALREYLTLEQNSYIVTEQVRELVKNDLIKPHLTLLDRDREEIHNFILTNNEGPVNFNINFNIISFNYTNTFEKILSPYQWKHIGAINNHNCYLKDIYHIHGTLEDIMIMGVNDISQLHNEDYKTRTDICDILVKPQSNNAIRSNNDINSKRLIQKADIIIVFGMSLGATDKLWWDLIGTKITSSKSKLILFEHIDQPINFRRGHRLGIMREEVIKKFTAHLNSSDISLRKIEENTYVNFSTDFFSKSKIK